MVNHTASVILEEIARHLAEHAAQREKLQADFEAMSPTALDDRAHLASRIAAVGQAWLALDMLTFDLTHEEGRVGVEADAEAA